MEMKRTKKPWLESLDDCKLSPVLTRLESVSMLTMVQSVLNSVPSVADLQRSLPIASSSQSRDTDHQRVFDK